MALLTAMGHRVSEQTSWGAVALIAVGGVADQGGSAPSSGNDSTATGGMRPGFFYGAADPRRPAGAAIGE